jgi:hypothetical protein
MFLLSLIEFLIVSLIDGVIGLGARCQMSLNFMKSFFWAFFAVLGTFNVKVGELPLSYFLLFFVKSFVECDYYIKLRLPARLRCFPSSMLGFMTNETF